jgi:hypothetical protein
MTLPLAFRIGTLAALGHLIPQLHPASAISFSK